MADAATPYAVLGDVTMRLAPAVITGMGAGARIVLHPIDLRFNRQRAQQSEPST